MPAVLILFSLLIFASAGPVLAVPVEWAPGSGARAGGVPGVTGTSDQETPKTPDVTTLAAATDPSAPKAPDAAPTPPAAPKIPDSTVQMFIRQGPESRFELFFIDVRYGYDLVDFEFYKAWCLLKDKPLRRNAIHKVKLYNCYDSNLPPEFKTIAWNQINYIINHKKGSKEAIQQAIWHFTNSKQSGKLKPEAYELIEEANLKGKDYKPGEGEAIAIICRPDIGKQPVFLEYKLPEAMDVAVASDVFLPILAAAEDGLFFPFIPIVPIVPPGDGSTPPGDSPPTPPPVPPAVPEPSSVLLLAAGMTGLLMVRAARKRRSS